MRGGIRGGAGRKAILTADARAEIKREFGVRMQVWAYATAYRADPKVQANLKIDGQIAEMFKRHGATLTPEDLETITPGQLFRRIPTLNRLRFEKARKAAGEPDLKALKASRAWGARDYIANEIAAERGISKRMVISCLND